MRGPLHILVAIALLTAFGQSPFAHFHEEESDHAQDHAQQHGHWAGHDTHSEPVWETEEHEEDALFVDWLAGDGSPYSKVWIVLPTARLAAPVFIQTSAVQAPSPRNHDPPCCANLPARAPPQ